MSFVWLRRIPCYAASFRTPCLTFSARKYTDLCVALLVVSSDGLLGLAFATMPCAAFICLILYVM